MNRKYILQSQNSQNIKILNQTSRIRINQINSSIVFNSIIHIPFLIIFFYIPIIKCQTNNQNYIINGNFTSPIITTTYQYAGNTIPGWTCSLTCQIINCTLMKSFLLSNNLMPINCTGQAIDLNSNFKNQKIIQKINLNTKKYIFSFNYYYPSLSAHKKQLVVYLNNHIIFSIHPQISRSFNTYYFQAEVEAIDGQNILIFQNKGLNDANGFKINNVSLIMIKDQMLQKINSEYFYYNNFFDQLPGIRVVFKSLLSFLINFDRLQLYIYHSLTYSYSAQMLLLAVSDFLNAKDSVPLGLLSSFSSKAPEHQTNFVNNYNFKREYITYNSFSQDYQSVNIADQLMQNVINFLPFAIMIFLFLHVTFRVFFQKQTSLLIRKFEFWGILLAMAYEGNIESFTFHFFAEFKNFFSQNYQHKFLNIFMIFLAFLVIFFAFGVLLWMKYHYGRKIRYLIDQGKAQLSAVWGVVIDRGIVCFLFGTIHQMLINQPNLQIFVLGLLEISWITKKINFFIWLKINQKWAVISSIFCGICRIIFQITCYMYHNKLEDRLFLNDYLQLYLIYTIIFFSVIQFVIGFIYSFKTFILILQKSSNKIYHYDQDLNKSLPKRKNNQKNKQQTIVYHLYKHKKQVTDMINKKNRKNNHKIS